MFIDNGSPNAVIASSNETPCFLRFYSAFRGSHSKLYSTSAFYRSALQVFIGITIALSRSATLTLTAFVLSAPARC